MIRIHFRTRAAYKLALDWLGKAHANEALASPQYIVDYYRAHAWVVVDTTPAAA